MPRDPEVLRSLASELRLQGERARDAAARVYSAVETASYEGPAADRLRDSTIERRSAAERAAADVNDAADSLLRLAAEAEAELEVQRLAALSGQMPDGTDY